GCWILNHGPAPIPQYLGMFTTMIAVLGAAVAMHFGPGINALREIPRQAMDKLAVTLWAQGGVLLAVAVALQFDGFGQSIGWLAVGLASIEIGRRIPSRGVTVFGLIVGALAVMRVMLVDWMPVNMHTPMWV